MKRRVRRGMSMLIVAIVCSCGAILSAQRGAAPGRGGPPPTPKAQATFDITGQWVAVVTEDWRYRMTVAPKGDYAGVPLNPNGRRAADAWDPARDESAGEQCKAYGVGGAHADADASSHHLARRPNAENRNRRGHADSNACVSAARKQGGDWQGVSIGELGPSAARDGRRLCSGGGAPRRLAQGRDDENEARISPQKRRAIQCGRSRHGVFRSIRRPERRFAAGRLDGGCRSNVPRDSRSGPARHYKKQNDATGWNPTPCAHDEVKRRYHFANTCDLRWSLASCAVRHARRRGRPHPTCRRRVRHLRILDAADARGRAWSGAPGPSSATTADFQSTTRPGCSRSPTTPLASRCAITSATATSRRTRFDHRQRPSVGRARPAHAAAHRHSLVQPDDRGPSHHLDGRPSASSGVGAAHVDGIFDRTFVGNALEVQTTHLKQGWLRRNGLPESDQATLVEFFVRHGDHLTHTVGDYRSRLSGGAENPHTDFCPAADRSPDVAVRMRRRRADSRTRRRRRAQLRVRQESVCERDARRYKIPAAAYLGGAETIVTRVRWPKLAIADRSGRRREDEARGRSPRDEPRGRSGAARRQNPCVAAAGHVYLLVGDAGNIVVQVGDEGRVAGRQERDDWPRRCSRRSASSATGRFSSS